MRLLFAILLALPALGAGPCDTPDHRAFDFWVGQWDVIGKNGKLAGANNITREYNNCVIHEHYKTPGAYAGESFNMYDRGAKVWRQTWVDTSGVILVLEGGIQDGAMVMEGKTVNRRGITIRNRITWTPNDDGTVRQHWQTAAPDADWITIFDGTYRPKAAE